MPVHSNVFNSLSFAEHPAYMSSFLCTTCLHIHTYHHPSTLYTMLMGCSLLQQSGYYSRRSSGHYSFYALDIIQRFPGMVKPARYVGD